jgi:hypothetical protein
VLAASVICAMNCDATETYLFFPKKVERYFWQMQISRCQRAKCAPAHICTVSTGQLLCTHMLICFRKINFPKSQGSTLMISKKIKFSVSFFGLVSVPEKRCHLDLCVEKFQNLCFKKSSLFLLVVYTVNDHTFQRQIMDATQLLYARHEHSAFFDVLMESVFRRFLRVHFCC